MLVHEMMRSECLRVLAGTRLGRLACARENQPYVVPIYFVYHEPYLYGFTTLGQKVEWMRSNPLVCVEVDEVEGSDNWTSIVIFGQYEELSEAPEWEERPHGHQPEHRKTARPTLTSSPERLHAYTLLQKHAEWWEPGSASGTQRNPEQRLTPVFYRIHIGRITGRRATSSASRPLRSTKPSSPGESQSWLRRIFHSLTRPPEESR